MNNKTSYPEAFFKLMIMILLIGAFLYYLGIMSVNSHEQVHQLIFSRYDIKSNITINSILSGKTSVLKEEYYKCNDYCKTQNALNDIIGYNVRTVIFNSWALLLTWIAYRRLYEKQKN